MSSAVPARETAADRPTPDRIATLDIVRGVAVMGILAMNIVAFAMPFAAYMNPTAYGFESNADLASWLFSFIFVDGKMRGLFSFLFGASTLLVIERAKAAGESPAKIHYMRMLWLLVFGLAHFYLIWFGDILAMYALVGLLLFFFRNVGVRGLLIWGVALVIVQSLIMAGLAFHVYGLASAADLSHAQAEELAGFHQSFGTPTPRQLAEDLELHSGEWSGLVRHRLIAFGAKPFAGVLQFGWETLAYMLFGMAALKIGFFRGEWTSGRYRRIAAIGLAISVPVYAALAWLTWDSGFSLTAIIASFGATTPVRPIMVFAYAALIILLTRNGGALVDRIAAAGRAAFTNYLSTSILMTTLFYGYGVGLYGSLSRIELWLPVFAMWALMLLWSKPWLERFRYGPFEWLWRSLARMRLEPMRRA